MRSSSRLTTVALAVPALALALGCSLALAKSTVSIPGYTGAEASLPNAYPASRDVKSGTTCTIGFQNPLAANESLQYVPEGRGRPGEGVRLQDHRARRRAQPRQAGQQHAAAARAGGAGDHLLPARPEGDDCRCSRRRRSKGVPVVAIDATFGNPKLPVTPGIVDPGVAGPRHHGLPAGAGAREGRSPKAKVGLIGIGAPVPALKYLNQREAFYAKKAGLTVVGTQDNPTDDVTGGEKAGNGADPALLRHGRGDRLQRPERARRGHRRARRRPEAHRRSA